jgi:hypothetical protein
VQKIVESLRLRSLPGCIVKKISRGLLLDNQLASMSSFVKHPLTGLGQYRIKLRSGLGTRQEPDWQIIAANTA